MGGLDRRGAVIAEWQRVTHRLLRALDAELADLRLSAGEVNALAALAEGPRTARALAEATAQHPSTLTGVLDRLERRGLVARRPNPADRRSTLIEPTEAGRPAVERAAPRSPRSRRGCRARGRRRGAGGRRRRPQPGALTTASQMRSPPAAVRRWT